MAHPQNNFTSQFQSDGQTGNAALTLNVNGENYVYTPQGNDQTVAVVEPVVFEMSNNPTYSEINEVLGQHIPCFLHISGTGTDYMLPYVGQSGDPDSLYFAACDAQNKSYIYYVCHRGTAWTYGSTAIVDAELLNLCEKVENKKNSITGNESSTIFYPTTKAVVDFLNAAMQNLGGKLITDNGDPFTDSADLPDSTPYHGVDIADKDYAYIQGIGTAERWSATVSGTSVSWLQEYAISIPVFTPQQQAAIDSGVTAAMLGTFLTKTGDGSNVTATFMASGSRTNISTGEKLSVIFGKIAKWFGDLKAVAFSGSYNDLTNTPTIPTELPVKIEEIGGSAVDLDSLTTSDMKVHYYTWSNGNRSNVSHKPTDAVYTVKVFPCGAGSAGTYVMQEAYKRGTAERYVRRRSDGGTSWSDWQLCTYANGSYSDMSVGAANGIIPSEFATTSSGAWVEVGTYKASSAGQMHSGITFVVRLRGGDTKTQSGFLWISVGENKSPATYSNDDIVCEYYTLGRRTKEVPASVKFYVNILGTSVTDGVKIYAHVDSWSLFSVTAINVPKGDYTPSMASVSEPATKKEVTYCNLLRSTYGTAIGSSSTPIYVNEYGIPKPCGTIGFADSAKQISDYRGTEGQDGYKNIYGGYNGGTGEFGFGISKRESGVTKYTEISADGITSSGIITAGVGFVGNLNGVANQAVSDSDGNNINTTYAKKIYGIYNIDTYLTDGNAFHDVNLRKQLGPRYVHARGFTPLMMFYGIINFIDIEYADGYDYAAVDFELYNTQQSGTYGTLMASIGMVVPKGTSSIVIPLPFAWNSGSFSPTLYGNFAHRITAGSAVCNAYYYSLPV